MNMSERNDKPNDTEVKTHEITCEYTNERGRVRIKHAGYAYKGCVHRANKAIPIEEWVETLNENAPEGTTFRVERV